MALRKRAPGLVCLLLLTAAALLLAGRSLPAAAPSGPDDEDAVQTLEQGTVYYEDLPRVQVLSLEEMSPVDTSPETDLLQEGGGTLSPVEETEMAEILAELYLKDGTGIRLYATAEGLVFGTFSRLGGGWTRFVRLCDGADLAARSAAGTTLTPFSGILEKEGFLLRTAGQTGAFYDYRYYWFDSAGGLQAITAAADPVSLDLDGDGQMELACHFNDRTAPFSFYYLRSDGSVCKVTPAEHLERADLHLARVEAEGPGPVRLVYSYQDAGETRYCAVTFQEEALRFEWDIVYVPGETPEDAVPAPELPDPAQEPWAAVSIAAPDGWVMEGAGRESCRNIWRMLQGGGDAVLVPTDAPLDREQAYTLTVEPAKGETVIWTVDGEGICRVNGLEGNYRILRTGSGSPPACFYDLLEICCGASRTSRAYDLSGRYLGGN